jgi:acetyl esterase/lipase
MVVTYRAFPDGYVSDQIADVRAAVTWALDHCHLYNGSRERVAVMGHSAGAHLSCMAVIDRLRYGGLW